MRPRTPAIGLALVAGLLMVGSLHARGLLDGPAFDRLPLPELRDLPLAPTPGVEEWLFRPDPLDPEPLGERIPVILVHGFESAVSHLPFDPNRMRHWDRFRSDVRYPTLFGHMKFYLFDYRPWPDIRQLGAEMADDIVREVLPEMAPDQEILFMGISAGALVSRYAAADERILPRVGNIFTLNGANRGSALASMREAKRSIWRQVGLLNWWLMRWSRKAIALSPGIRSLAYDNFDGAISKQAVERWGLWTNPELRIFNENDPNRHKIIAYQSIPGSMFGRGRFGVENWMRVKVLRRIHPSFRTADPILHDRSGLLAGVEVASRRTFPGLDHWQLNAPQVVDQMYADLDEVQRAVTARRMWRAGESLSVSVKVQVD